MPQVLTGSYAGLPGSRADRRAVVMMPPSGTILFVVTMAIALAVTKVVAMVLVRLGQLLSGLLLRIATFRRDLRVHRDD